MAGNEYSLDAMRQVLVPHAKETQGIDGTRLVEDYIQEADDSGELSFESDDALRADFDLFVEVILGDE
jgi:hypothetical protein